MPARMVAVLLLASTAANGLDAFGDKQDHLRNLYDTPAVSHVSAPKGASRVSLGGQSMFRTAERLYFYDAMTHRTAVLRDVGLQHRCPSMRAQLKGAMQARALEGGTHTYSQIYDLIKAVAQASRISTVIETGTSHGGGTTAIAKFASRVYSIELQDSLYRENVARFASQPKVTIKHGNSAEQIAVIIRELAGTPTVFFLDGHWSEGDTALGSADKGGETPILAELEHVLNYVSIEKSAVIIDDSRLFMGFDDPLCLNGNTCYPSVRDVVDLICASKHGDRLHLYIRADQIVIIPRNARIN